MTLAFWKKKPILKEMAIEQTKHEEKNFELAMIERIKKAKFKKITGKYEWRYVKEPSFLNSVYYDGRVTLEKGEIGYSAKKDKRIIIKK